MLDALVPMPPAIPQDTPCTCGHTKAWHVVNQRCQHPECKCVLFVAEQEVINAHDISF
jgi:hypothetical protein